MCVAIIGIACSGSDFTEKTVTINLVFNLPINKQLCQCQLRTLGTVRVGQRKKHLTAQIYFTDAQKIIFRHPTGSVRDVGLYWCCLDADQIYLCFLAQIKINRRITLNYDHAEFNLA